ncbi:MAG: (Fe-S)-binding protein [Pseudomonadota bacterium]
MEMESELALKEYEAQLWSCQNCFCGLCVESCPAYRESHREAVSARGLAQIGLGLLSGELKLSDLPDELIYACVECRYCETVCSMNTPLYIKRHGTRETKVSGATIAEKIRSMKIEEGGRIPSEIKGALTSLARYGNPYGVGEAVKDDWVAGLDMTLKDADTILYVGATVPYDDNCKKMAEAVIYLLRIGQLRFGMLGSKERESGAFARMMGEEWLFAEMMEHNATVFKDHGIKQIICLSPHDYDAFQRYYTNMEEIAVFHYTQVLAEMLEKGKIRIEKKLNKRITYHDPCYLGRQNNLYEEPRKILRSIPGLDLVEMKRSRDNALCCGGGGTGLFMELPNFHIDKARAALIKEVNPDCVAVACPNCYQMLDSAIKGLQLEVEVKDIAQLVMEAL